MSEKVDPAYPRKAARAVGASTRASILKEAIPLFLKHGHESVSVSDVAKAAGVYPNQITHHFGGKDPLFVEAASLAILRAAKQAERITRDSPTVQEHAQRLLSNLLGPNVGAVLLFAEAMLMARRKKDGLQSIIAATLAQLNTAGELAMEDTLARTQWTNRVDSAVVTRAFWASIFGLALEKAALGEHFEDASAQAVAHVLNNLNQAFGVESSKKH